MRTVRTGISVGGFEGGREVQDALGVGEVGDVDHLTPEAEGHFAGGPLDIELRQQFAGVGHLFR